MSSNLRKEEKDKKFTHEVYKNFVKYKDIP